jgi:hypothetical protein
LNVSIKSFPDNVIFYGEIVLFTFRPGIHIAIRDDGLEQYTGQVHL